MCDGFNLCRGRRLRGRSHRGSASSARTPHTATKEPPHCPLSVDAGGADGGGGEHYQAPHSEGGRDRHRTVRRGGRGISGEVQQRYRGGPAAHGGGSGSTDGPLPSDGDREEEEENSKGDRDSSSSSSSSRGRRRRRCRHSSSRTCLPSAHLQLLQLPLYRLLGEDGHVG